MSAPQRALVFRDRSKKSALPQLGGQDHREENRSTVTLSNKASRKSCSPHVWGDIQGYAQLQGHRAVRKGPGSAKQCSLANVPVTADSRLALGPTLCSEGCVMKAPHTLGWKRGTQCPESLPFPFYYFGSCLSAHTHSLRNHCSFFLASCLLLCPTQQQSLKLPRGKKVIHKSISSEQLVNYVSLHLSF